MQSSFLKDRLRRLHIVKPSRRAPDNHEADGDTSYEDALLDLQLRNYFRTEYGMAEPPSGIFSSLLAAIRAHESGNSPAADTRPVAAFLSVYRALRTSTAHRLVSGGVAATIMLAIISSSSVSFLRSTTDSFVDEESTPVAASTRSTEEAMEWSIERDNRYVIYHPSISPDPAFYDPVELRMPLRTDAASGSTTPSRWQRFGGQ